MKLYKFQKLLGTMLLSAVFVASADAASGSVQKAEGGSVFRMPNSGSVQKAEGGSVFRMPNGVIKSAPVAGQEIRTRVPMGDAALVVLKSGAVRFGAEERDNAA